MLLCCKLSSEGEAELAALVAKMEMLNGDGFSNATAAPRTRLNMLSYAEHRLVYSWIEHVQVSIKAPECEKLENAIIVRTAWTGGEMDAAELICGPRKTMLAMCLKLEGHKSRLSEGGRSEWARGTRGGEGRSGDVHACCGRRYAKGAGRRRPG